MASGICILTSHTGVTNLNVRDLSREKAERWMMWLQEKCESLLLTRRPPALSPAMVVVVVVAAVAAEVAVAGLAELRGGWGQVAG